MAKPRKCTDMEFVDPRGYRFGLDADGWRLMHPRQLGQRDLENARALLEQAEACQPPPDPDRVEPFTLQEVGEHAAKTLRLRVTHRYFLKR